MPVAAGLEEDIQLQINGNYFGHWTEVEVGLGIDEFSTVAFSAPFDASRKEFRDIFRPFEYQAVQLATNLVDIFHGFVVNVQPKFEPNGSSVAVTGYAKPGVLCDCTLPQEDPTAVPPVPVKREFKKGQTIRQIAEQCCAPFGIAVEMGAAEGKGFDKVRISPEKKIHEFLMDLAKQRNLVLGNTIDGKLLIWQSIEVGTPVASFVQGKAPLGTVETQFSPQGYFSEITGHAAKKRGKAPAKWTEQNPWLKSPLRPDAFKLEDTERADAPEATQAKLGRMFAGMVCYTLADLPGWRDPHGDLWKPNTTVKLLAPDAMVYRETEFLVRRVKLKQTQEANTATLELCLPGSFNGRVPARLPWQDVTEFEAAAANFFV